MALLEKVMENHFAKAVVYQTAECVIVINWKAMETGCISAPIEQQKKDSFYQKIDDRVSLLLTWVYWCFH